MRLTLISTPIGFLGSGRGGGVELTLNSLVNGLLEQGHKVRVIAPINSELTKHCNDAQLYCVDGEEKKSWQHQDYYSLDDNPGNSIVNNMLEKALSFKSQSDAIINLSYDWLPIWKTLDLDIPLLHIVSMGDESHEIKKIIKVVYAKYPNNFAFHSKIQSLDYSFINDPIIIGNGFQLSNYNFNNSKKGPIGWIGRVAPEKGLEDAAYVANEIGEILNVWGFIEDKAYASKIENSFPNGLISWKGFLKTNELQEELGKCRALINTPKWNEAYGNVVVEAMACGVPVISYEKGGPSEIIKHGKTGFLVEPNHKEGLIHFLKNIETIDRKDCRDWVKNNASSQIFATKVVNWLKKVIKEYQLIPKL